MAVRVGVIGVGYLGFHHARVYHELDEAELVGVADSDITRADEVAGKFGCRAFREYADLLPHVDALSIVTPTLTHHDIGMDCIQAGKDLLIEKPITAGIDEAEELVSSASKAGRVLQVGHLERFNPVVIAAEEFIEEPRFFESERLSPFLGRGTDVDVTLDLMIHDIDIILSLCHGRVRELRATGASVLSDNIDVSKAWVEMDNGVSALITAGRLSPVKKRILKIFQDSGYILLDYQEMMLRHYYRGENGTIKTDTMRPEQKEPLKEELRDFLRCVRDRSTPRVTGEDGLEALKVVLEISKKIKENL